MSKIAENKTAISYVAFASNMIKHSHLYSLSQPHLISKQHSAFMIGCKLHCLPLKRKQDLTDCGSYMTDKTPFLRFNR